MADLGLEESLVRVKATILECPASESGRQDVEKELQVVLKKTACFQSYSEPEFLRLMKFFILGVGYARSGISKIQLLSALSAVVPPDLGVNILFPVTDENGSRRLWYYSDLVPEVRIAAALNGERLAHEVLVKFGMYSLFVAGIMPDMLKMAERKKGVDVTYYERVGSLALKSAATTLAGKSADTSTLEELASDFPYFRRVLNEAGALVGTAARQTLFDNILERYGIQGNHVMPRGPLTEKKQRGHQVGGIPFFQQGAEYGTGTTNVN